MATKTIKLHVSSNNNTNGVLNVKVTPWRMHLDSGDVVEWELDSNGPASNDILWFRVEQIDRVNAWPFKAPLPPDTRYTALAPNGRVTTMPKDNTANNLKDVVAYGLTIGFRDDNNHLRTMYIDPD